MKSGSALVVFIVDASGSMSNRQGEVNQSINSALKTHRETPGEAIITLYQFDDKVKKLIDFKNVNEVSDFEYQCEGMTALYDAIGTAIDEIGLKLSLMSEDERPEQVQIMIITDGGENSSRRYSSSKVSEMVKHQTSKYSWIFTYLGSNQDAIFTGATLGIAAAHCANYSDNNLSKTVNMVSSKMAFARCATNSMDAFASMEYSALERESLVN